MSLSYYLSLCARFCTVSVLAFIFFMLIKMIVIPLQKLGFYKNQRLPCHFYPFLGFIHRGTMHEERYNDIFAFYKKLAQRYPNVPAEVTHFGNVITIVLLDSRVIKDFYNKQSFYKKINFSKAVFALTGTGLVFAEGNLWKNHRKVISNLFHFEFIKQNIPLVVETTREFLDNLAKTPMRNVNIMDEIQKITGEIVGRIFFGQNLNKYTFRGVPLTLYMANVVVRLALAFRDPLAVFFIFAGIDIEWIPRHHQYMEDIREIRQFCLQIVQDRKASNKKTQVKDMLGLLLETQKLSKPEDRFSDEDIVNEFVTFFIAGMDTTGHLITMALYLLYKNPTYIKDIEKEIKEYYNKKKIVDSESLNKMDHTYRVLKETLRLYTPAPGTFPRVALADHDLMGIKIKKGDSVRPMFLYNYHNPKYFDDPEKFYPERWNSKKIQELDQFVDIPFSAGARNCIGQHLAMIEAKIIIAEFINKFKFKVVPEDYILRMTFSFLYEPKQKILMDLNLKKKEKLK